MRRRPWCAALTVAVAGLLSAGSAAASPSAKLVYLRVGGAEACPGEQELRRAVAVRIGYDPFFPVAQKTVVVEVQRIPTGYRGRVQIVGEDGNVRGARELSTTGEDCGELVGALALAVSIALDDLDEAPPAGPPDTPSAPAEPPTAPPATISPPTTPPSAAGGPPTSSRPRSGAPAELVASLGPTVALGTAPDVAAGASVGAALRWTSVALRADVRGELPSSGAIPQGGRIATQVIVATASGCLRARIPFVCLGGGGGGLFSSTKSITRPANDQAALLVVAARSGLSLSIASGLYVEPFAEMGANLLTPRVRVDGRTAYTTSPVWGVLGFYIGVRLF